MYKNNNQDNNKNNLNNHKPHHPYNKVNSDLHIEKENHPKTKTGTQHKYDQIKTYLQNKPNRDKHDKQTRIQKTNATNENTI